MIIVGNPKYRLISLAVTVVILIVVYFTVIKSSNDTVNNALRTSQQELNNAFKQSGQSASGAASAASKLQACILAAGTDVSKAQACAAKFTP